MQMTRLTHDPSATSCTSPPAPHAGSLPPPPCRLAEGTRAAVAAWGLKLLCREPRWQSDTLTVVEVPEGLDSQKIVDTAFAK